MDEQIQTVQVQIDVPKESKEVIDALAKVYELAAAKSELAEYMGAIGDLTKAIDGAGKIGDEAKSKHKAGLIGYFTYKVASFF